MFHAKILRQSKAIAQLQVKGNTAQIGRQKNVQKYRFIAIFYGILPTWQLKKMPESNHIA